MRMIKSIAITLTILLAGCGGNESGKAASTAEETTPRLVVYTVNYPLAYFAERIGGDLVDVHFPVPADVDPAFWSPDTRIIAGYQGADLILLNGADYAKWVQRATLHESRLVDTGAAFADQLIEMKGVTTHSHGPGGAHEHKGWAFTTWLDPAMAIQQAEAITRALIALRPVFEAEFNERFTALADELHGLDQRLAAAAEDIGGAPLVFSHPVYQYLIRRYSLNAVEVHWEPGETPAGDAWNEIEAVLEEHPARWMLWESQPVETTIAGLSDLGVKALVFNPVGNRPHTGDFMTVMAANAAAMETITP
jgi:zinc transport system substrate-binding protein